jgi:hypothetical protein
MNCCDLLMFPVVSGGPEVRGNHAVAEQVTDFGQQPRRTWWYHSPARYR